MLSQEEIQSIAPRIRQTQIVAAALLLGMASFVGLLCIIVDWPKVTWQLSGLCAIGLAFGFVMLAMAWMIPRLIAEAGTKRIAEQMQGILDDKHRQTASGKLAGLYTSVILVGLSLVESAVLFNLVVFLIDRRLPSLIFAALALINAVFVAPTTNRAIQWLEDRLDDLKRGR